MTTPRLVAMLTALVVVTQAAYSQNGTRAPSPAPVAVRTATVTYISGTTIYVNAGRDDGVREGTTFEVLHAGAVVATIAAKFLSSRSVSCEVVNSVAVPQVGDSVRYTPARDSSRVTADSGRGTVATRASGIRRPPAMRGHLGVRYLRVAPANTPGTAYTLPSVDVRLDGNRVGDAPIGMIVDVRGRRSAFASANSANSVRVHEASTSYTHAGSGLRMSIGRQYSNALSPVSLFDGVLAALDRTRWAVGAFNGTQPDLDLGWSRDVRQFGGYLQLHSAPLGTSPWSLTAGGVSSSADGAINREFAFAQLIISGAHLSIYATQEIDFNRGWKRDVGESAVAPTSTFASAQLRLGDLTLNAGADNRRNVRLYRDYINPLTEFEDAFRQGVWGGASVTLFRKLRIGGDARTSSDRLSGESGYYTGSLSLDRIGTAGLGTRVRATRFKTSRATGWLHAWSISASPAAILSLEASGGIRTQSPVASASDSPLGVVPSRVSWFGLNVDVSLGRSWYAALSGTQDGTGASAIRQAYGSLVFRF